eukprot:TRINITY_DN29097_c0_g1_i1.p1 TRINITY_DN29097_c0_g1~~TRINITY_DN29097_c0_g1_i1.p1  ORF type:complete len:574 (-),score=116.11 TRINITY_DN29097_c0_g1_i1:546-2267(-)
MAAIDKWRLLRRPWCCSCSSDCGWIAAVSNDAKRGGRRSGCVRAVAARANLELRAQHAGVQPGHEEQARLPPERTGRGVNGAGQRAQCRKGRVRGFEALMLACKKRSSWPDSLALVDERRCRGLSPDVVAIGAAASRAGAPKHWRAALAIMACAGAEGLQTNVFLSSMSVSAFGKASAWKRAVDHLRVTLERTLGLDIISWSAAASTCERVKWQMSWQLVQHIRLGLVEQDSGVYIACFGALQQRRRWEAAGELLELMEQRSVEQSEINVNAAASSAEKAGRWKLVMEVVGLLAGDLGLRATVVTLDAAASACAAAALWQRAWFMLGRCQETSLKANVITHSAVASACDLSQVWERASHVTEQMKKTAIRMNEVTLTAVASACVAAYAWSSALTWLDAPEAGLRATSEAASSALGACAQASLWLLAVELLAPALSSKSSQDAVALATAVATCERAERWRQSLWLAASAQELRLCLEHTAYRQAVRACGRAGQWLLAFNVVQEMTAANVADPEDTVYSTAVWSYEVAAGRSCRCDGNPWLPVASPPTMTSSACRPQAAQRLHGRPSSSWGALAA